MEAGKYNIEHSAGASFELSLILKTDETNTFDLTGCTPHAQVRKRAGADALVIQLSPVVADAAGGRIVIAATDEVTALWKAGHWQWDLMIELADGTVTAPILAGSFVVTNTVTRLS